MKILMFGHSGHDNHGCEAIVRSTSKQVINSFDRVQIKIASYRPIEDVKVEMDEVTEYISHSTPIRKCTMPWLKSIYFNRITKNYEASFKISQRGVIKEAARSDICLSIGGDNYCYGEPLNLYAVDTAVKKSGRKLILWGASIDPTYINERMVCDLSQFDALFTRESISYNALKNLNINKNLFLYPDPAFTMEKEITSLPNGWVEGKMIGLNLSPLINKYEKNSGMTYTSYQKLIEYIIEETKLSIVLISHVTVAGNSDYEVLEKLYEEFKNSTRVILLDMNYTAPQLKGFISRCRLFIGARTHATIAAYSTCVPTIVIGYSVKARGIARDIFGCDQHYVLPVQELEDPSQILNGLKFLLQYEKEIREHLIKVMPQYINSAYHALDKLNELTQDKK